MFESLNEFVLTVIVLLSGGVICLFTGKLLDLRLGIVAALIGWHTLLAAVYGRYVLLNGGDAFTYYQRARFDFVEPALGTDFVVWITSFPVEFGFAYWPLTALYNVLGTLGLVFFYAALKETEAFRIDAKLGRLLAYLCLFIPSMSFWTSGIGKDSIACLAVTLFLWATMQFDRRRIAAVVAILLMFAVRPHIAALMMMSIGAGAIFMSHLRGTTRLGVAVAAIVTAMFAVPLALVYSGSTDFASIGEYVADRQEQNLRGGSSVDIAGMNPALRVFSYLYRPLPNEVSDIAQLAASLDNVILILLTIFGIVAIYRAGFFRVYRHYSIVMMYGVSSLIVLSQVTANLGLASRQKWMVVPALMLVLVGAWVMARQKAAKKRQTARYIPVSAQALR